MKNRVAAFVVLSVVAVTLFTLSTKAGRARAGLPARPPQYVALAFDNCDRLENWRLSREFSQELARDHIEQHFTYFISSVYYLNSSKRALYQGPHHRAGASDIGFADSNDEILQRIEQLNLAVAEGHEIGSHAAGHFDGTSWSAEDWDKEFNLSQGLLFKTFMNNDLRPEAGQPVGFDFRAQDIVGFRAPYLSTSPGLWKALSKNNFRYDTSRISDSNYWPEKTSGGFWNFPLVTLKIEGSGKPTLSMDYNFYVADSNAKPDSAHSKKFEKQMFDTYMKYFTSNYNGNRAPIHIGHHFELWNGGAYWRAMKAFARTVCAKPEVRCVTYRELADYMDSLDSATLASYREGRFERAF